MASLALRSGRAFLKGATAEELDRHRHRTEVASSSSSSCSLGRRKSNSPLKQQTTRNALISTANTNANRNPIFLGIGNQETFKIGGQRDKKRDPVINPERLDEWMTQSVKEIVRNIGEAPFLVHVYSDREEGSPARLERENATEDNWPHIATRWAKEKANGTTPPDGVILVKQLDDNNKAGENNSDANSSSSLCSGLWGIVIQGRGLDRSACYILETTKVCSSMGFCTHFCLARAKCFGKSPELQLRDSWLLTQ